MSNIQDLSEAQSKLIYGRISQTEKSINLLSESFEKLGKKEYKVCNKLDELSNKLKYISESDNFDESFAKLFEIMTTATAHIADIVSNKVERYEEKLIPGLIQYHVKYKKTRDDAKSLTALRDFELNKKIKKTILNENDAMLSNIQVSKVLKEILVTSEKFEAQKLNDFKQFFLNFMLIEMKFFASGITILTEAYEDILKIGEPSEQFSIEMKGYNKQFKMHIQQDTRQGNKLPFLQVFSRFSQSSSNINMIGKDDFLAKKKNTSNSLMSLSTLDTKKHESSRKRILIEKTESSTDDSNVDDDSTDTEPTDTNNSKNKPHN